MRGPDLETVPPAAEYEWKLPAGFPRPLVPADNPMSAVKVELGRLLFYDNRLSGNETFSCASCHRPERAFTDGRAQAIGATGELHRRSAMSLANVAYSATLTWSSPTLASLEAQMHIPMFNENPVELGLTGLEDVVLERLASDPRYPRLFARAFETAAPATFDQVIQAIAAFERTLISGSSAYDRLVFGGDHDALSEGAKRGMRLFFDERLGCFHCHSGLNFSGPVVYQGSAETEVTFHNTGLYNVGGDGSYPASDRGLIEETGVASDMGRFRAPTLRNVAVTAPYMHDGSIATLGEVIDHYSAGGRTLLLGPHAGVGSTNPYKSERITGFEISPDEKRDLVAFLESLTDRDFLDDPLLRSPFPQ